MSVKTGKEVVMTSNILNSVGLGTIDIAYFFIGLIVVIFILLILIIVLMVQTKKLKTKYAKFMKGKEAKSLEDNIINLFEDNKFLKESAEENRKDIRKLYNNMEYAFQKVGVVKYDAFKQMGGMLSFSLALLNDKNNGFIINSVHSSDGCYSYTKEVRSGESKISLGEEEKKALEIAMSSNQRTSRG